MLKQKHRMAVHIICLLMAGLLSLCSCSMKKDSNGVSQGSQSDAVACFDDASIDWTESAKLAAPLSTERAIELLEESLKKNHVISSKRQIQGIMYENRKQFKQEDFLRFRVCGSGDDHLLGTWGYYYVQGNTGDIYECDINTDQPIPLFPFGSASAECILYSSYDKGHSHFEYEKCCYIKQTPYYVYTDTNDASNQCYYINAQTGEVLKKRT